MELSENVKEFRALQKTQKVRVADFCRERVLDYYEIVEVLNEGPRADKVFIFMHKSRRQLRMFNYERNGYVLSENKLYVSVRKLDRSAAHSS